MSSPRLRPRRWIVVFGLAGGCANLIGLSEYEENDNPVGIGEGGDGFSPLAGAGNSDGGNSAGDGGEPASKSTGGQSAGAGGRGNAGANDGGDGGVPETTGGRRASGGRRGDGGTTAGGTAQTGGTSAGSNDGGAAVEGGSGGNATGGVISTGGVPATGGTPSTGGTSTGGNTQGPTTCTLSGFSADCRECIDDRCDAECDPCLADAECATLTTCLQNCETETCLNGCFDAYEDANDAFLAVYNCAFTTCASVCAPFGSPCENGGDCESEYCSTNGGGYCSLPCTTHDDCPSSGWCAQDFDGVTKCMPACEDQSECEAGYGCAYVQLNDPEYGREVRLLCTPEAGILDPCSSDSECHASECSGSNGYCTGACELIGECPVGSFCVDSTSGGPRCTIECYDDTDCLPYDTICVNVPDTEDYLVDVCEL